MIRTTHPDRICYRPGVMFTSPDRGTRHMSFWRNPDEFALDSMCACPLGGIQMELLRIAMRAPCHQGEGSLHLAHADGSPCDIPPSPDISHPLIALTCRVFLSVYSATVFSWNFLIFPTDILRYFGIFCFRYLLSKSPNSPCNPPIIGFLSL